VKLFDIFGKKDVGEELVRKVPYGMKLTFHPYRLNANKMESVLLIIELKNLKEEVLLTSIVIQLPKNLGFDQMALSNAREIRLGELKPGEEKVVKVEIWGNPRTDSGEYPIEVTAICHYRNYGYLLNKETSRIELRAV
jgi:uncharacterized membrane protein